MRSDDLLIIQVRREIVPLGTLATRNDALLQEIRARRIDAWKGHNLSTSESEPEAGSQPSLWEDLFFRASMLLHRFLATYVT